jgi:hypothetical protein
VEAEERHRGFATKGRHALKPGGVSTLHIALMGGTYAGENRQPGR